MTEEGRLPCAYRVARFAWRCRNNVERSFARCRLAVVAGGTSVGNADMGKMGRRPGRRVVTGLARRGRKQMSSLLANGVGAIVAVGARPGNAGVIE